MSKTQIILTLNNYSRKHEGGIFSHIQIVEIYRCIYLAIEKSCY